MWYIERDTQEIHCRTCFSSPFSLLLLQFPTHSLDDNLPLPSIHSPLSNTVETNHGSSNTYIPLLHYRRFGASNLCGPCLSQNMAQWMHPHYWNIDENSIFLAPHVHTVNKQRRVNNRKNRKNQGISWIYPYAVQISIPNTFLMSLLSTSSTKFHSNLQYKAL